MYQKYPLATVTSGASGVAQVIYKPFNVHNAMAQVVVVSGTGSVSVQFAGSNDNTNWVNIGSAVTETDYEVALNTNEVYQQYKATPTVSEDASSTVTFFFE